MQISSFFKLYLLFRCLDDKDDKHDFPMCLGPVGENSISSDLIPFNQLPCTYRRSDFRFNFIISKLSGRFAVACYSTFNCYSTFQHFLFDKTIIK